MILGSSKQPAFSLASLWISRWSCLLRKSLNGELMDKLSDFCTGLKTQPRSAYEVSWSADSDMNLKERKTKTRAKRQLITRMGSRLVESACDLSMAPYTICGRATLFLTTDHPATSADPAYVESSASGLSPIWTFFWGPNTKVICWLTLPRNE